MRSTHWDGCGPHSAQECSGYAPNDLAARRFPRQPQQIPDMAGVRRMFDGYDTGITMADEFTGRLLQQRQGS